MGVKRERARLTHRCPLYGF